MRTSINKILKFNPCKEGFVAFAKLFPGADGDTQIDVLDILSKAGVSPALWSLRAVTDEPNAAHRVLTRMFAHVITLTSSRGEVGSEITSEAEVVFKSEELPAYMLVQKMRRLLMHAALLQSTNREFARAKVRDLVYDSIRQGG